MQEALRWHLDQGAAEVLSDQPIDRFKHIQQQTESILAQARQSNQGDAPQPEQGRTSPETEAPAVPLGASEARAEATKHALAANTLDELKDAIAAFEGLALKKTASNLVFGDGNTSAPIMLIGEAPGKEEDIQAKPFVGQSGQLLDRILNAIGVSRSQDDKAQAIYMTNILNWRPPGNRTPSQGEIDVSLPFVERHIQLIQPKLLVFCGGVPAKALLGKSEGISRLRNGWHDYLPQSEELREGASPIPAIATFHPSYLLKTPSQKKSIWADMISLQKKMEEIGIN